MRLIHDALTKMDATIDGNLFDSMQNWTGQKPYYLKWILSESAKALNQEQIDHHVNRNILHSAQALFLRQSELSYHFAHLWSHTTPRQQTVLSLIAAQRAPYTYPQILVHSQV